jgi:hypothetical protein
MVELPAWSLMKVDSIPGSPDLAFCDTSNYPLSAIT